MTVTGIERVEAALNLSCADRVPVDIRGITHVQALTGIPLGRLMNDFELSDRAFEKSLEVYGDYDVYPNGITIIVEYVRNVTPFVAKIPGRDGWPEDREAQVLDVELLTENDYDLILERGFLRHYFSVLSRSKEVSNTIPRPALAMFSRLPRGLFMTLTKKIAGRNYRALRPWFEKWTRKGKWIYAGAMPIPPFETFMLLRSVAKGMVDLYERPDKVKAATAVLARECAELYLANIEASGAKTVMLGGAHASNTYISPKMYEEFDLPYTLELVRAFADAGIITVLHFDANWTKNLPLLRAFPAKKCILHLDGFSDVFQAKEILGDRLCIMGDVHPALLVGGSKDEVAEYCRRLIKVVGKGGGFILAPGCECPLNARPENVKVMVEIAHEEGRY